MMERSQITRIEPMYAHRPPRDFARAVFGPHDCWKVNPQELARAEWLWYRRPAGRAYRFMVRHAFLTFGAVTFLTLPLVAYVHVLAWLPVYAGYPTYMIWMARRIARWEHCYRQARWRVITR